MGQFSMVTMEKYHLNLTSEMHDVCFSRSFIYFFPIQMVMEFPHTVLHFDSHQTNSSQIKQFIEVRLLCKNVAKAGSAMS